MLGDTGRPAVMAVRMIGYLMGIVVQVAWWYVIASGVVRGKLTLTR